MRTLHLHRSALVALAGAMALSACGGGSGSGSIAAPPAAGTLAKGRLALTIVVPARATAAASSRRPAYISAATQSLSVTVTQGTTTVLQQAVGLTVAANPANCTASGGATTCTVILGLAAGSYEGTFATYDGPVVNGAPSGAALSSRQSITLTATAGQTNLIGVVLDGVPASIQVAPATGSTITGTQATSFAVSASPQPLTVEALDADGNIILGSGAPVFSATVTGPLAVTQPQSGTPNQITLASTGSGSGSLTVTAAAPDGGFSCPTSGVVCAATVAITGPLHHLFVAGNGLAVYTSPDDASWTLASSSTGTIGDTLGLVLAPNGDALAMDAIDPPNGAGAVDVFAPPYTGTPVYNEDTPVPFTPAMTGSGNLIFESNGNIYTLAPPYTEAPTQTATGYSTVAIGIDSYGNAIVSETYPASNTLSLAQPGYSVATTIAPGVGGYLAISSTGTVGIAKLASPYAVVVLTPPYGTPLSITTNGAQPDGGIAFDSNGNVWAQLNDGSLRKFSAPFTTNESPSVNVSLGITANMLTADSSGDVMVIDGTHVKIYGPTGTLLQTLSPPGSARQAIYVP